MDNTIDAYFPSIAASVGGWFSGPGGDINNDTYSDLLINYVQWPTWGINGRVDVFFGSAVFPLNPTPDIADFKGLNGGDELGSSFSAKGDVNRDGFCDMIIGEDGTAGGGKAYILSITNVTPPVIGSITPSPASVTNDNSHKLSFTSTLTGKAGGTGAVYIDLSPIGKSSTQTLFNVGVNTYKVSNITVPLSVIATTYTLTLYAYNNIESGYNLIETSITILSRYPAVPEILNISAVSSNGINIVWEDIANATSYSLFRSTNNNTNSATNIFGSASVTNYTNKGLATNTTYYYCVKAYNTYGSSAYSTVA